MNTYQALIADDEPLLCLELSELLTQCAPDIHVAGICHDGNAALEFIKTHPLDIVFLDIQMPEQTGIAVARALAGLPEAPAIVFVTAHSGFALDAFGVNALDYLLNPRVCIGCGLHGWARAIKSPGEPGQMCGCWASVC